MPGGCQDQGAGLILITDNNQGHGMQGLLPLWRWLNSSLKPETFLSNFGLENNCKSVFQDSVPV